MDFILDLAWQFRFVLVVVVAVALFALFEWEKFKQVAYKMMLQAKTMAKDMVLHSGKEQEDWVVEKVYMFMPLPAKVFISKKLLRKIVKFLYDKGKDYIDDGKLNNSI